MMQGDERAFLAGFVLYDEGRGDDDGIVFGHSGLGGSTALCRCENGDVLSVAVTLNRLSFDSSLTRRVVRQAFTELQLPVPAAFAKE